MFAEICFMAQFHNKLASLHSKSTLCGYINLGMFLHVCLDLFYEICPTCFSDIISLIPKLAKLTFNVHYGIGFKNECVVEFALFCRKVLLPGAISMADRI